MLNSEKGCYSRLTSQEGWQAFGHCRAGAAAHSSAARSAMSKAVSGGGP